MRVVGLLGFEPRTYPLSRECSDRDSTFSPPVPEGTLTAEDYLKCR